MSNQMNLNFDSDGDGVNDSFFTQLDTTEDGVGDTNVLFADENQNGFLETSETAMMFMDTDIVGTFDTQIYWEDVDGSGTPEKVVVTENSTTIYHFNETTGGVDLVEQFTDTNNTGTYDTHDIYEDLDENPGFDVHTQTQENTDGSMTYTVESNVEGVESSVSIFTDVTGDSIFDVVETHGDINNDKVTDYVSHQILDEHGEVQTYIFSEDANNDSIFEKITIYEDTDRNGSLETATAYADTNDDGYLEIVPLEYEPHTDYQGEYEPGYGNLDNDGVPDLLPADYDPNEYKDYDGDTYTNFHSVSVDPSEIIGNPGESMQYWEYQHYSGPCALETQRAMIEELTGQDLETEDFVRIATENGWYNDGTSFEDVGRMLEYYDVDNSGIKYNGNEQNLIDCLNNGGRILVTVDGNELWGQADSPNANHAVEVIGYYTGDPNTTDDDMVIINDSGCPDGRGAMIPVEQFMNAWEDGGYQYVEAYA